MLKKIISTSILGISALAVMTANAATLSDTSKTTNAKKNNKSVQAAPLQGKSKPAVSVIDENNQPINPEMAFASQSGLPAGLYVSGQVGYADTHMQSKLPSIVGVGLANNGLASRIAMGYKLSPNFAIEAGYLQLQQGKAIGATDTAYNKQNAIDIAGKGILPLTHNVSVYGKVGVAYLTTQLQTKGNQGRIPVTSDDNSEYDIAKHKWAPEVAVGMGYDITPNVTVDTSFTHIQPLGSTRPGNIDFLAVGVGYNFG